MRNWLCFILFMRKDSITPAAPAAEPELAPRLLGDYYELSDDQQLAIMRLSTGKIQTIPVLMVP